MNKNIDSSLDQARTALQGVQNMFKQLLEQRTELQVKRQNIFNEREALLVQPFTKAEVLQAMCEVVDVRARSYLKKIQQVDLFDLMAHPVERGHGEYPRPRPHDYPLALCDLNHITFKPEPYARDVNKIEKRPALKEHGWHFPVVMRGPELDASFNYFYFGDIIKKKLCAAFAGSEDGVLLDNGLPNATSLEERRSKVDQLSQELQKIDQELGALQQDIDSVTAPVLSSAKTLRDSEGTSV